MIWKLSERKDWNSLEQQFGWVRDMNQVPQHTVHHAEGSVAVHTRMVLEALLRQPAYPMLPEQEREILWAAALLHDVEKRSTSVDEGNGQVTSKNHAKRGETTVRTLLYRDIPAPFNIREHIASLVRHHGLPIWLMEREDPLKRACEASLRLDTSLLKQLTVADICGRISTDKEVLLEATEFFEMFCREQQCWGKAREFANGTARFHYFHTPRSYIDYVPHDDFKCEVTLLVGLPGMGKDYYIESRCADMPVVSLDAIRRKHKFSPTDKAANGWVAQTAKEQARIYLRKGQDFIWNATNVSRQRRTQLIDLFITYGSRVKIVYIEKPYSVWRRQNSTREYEVPETVLDKMLGRLEVPQLTEAHEIVYVVEE